MRKILLIIIALGVSGFISGCSEESNKTINEQQEVETTQQMPLITTRWYTTEQTVKGYPLYQANCAVCHKPDASGTENWQQQDANGNLPPPPLNGTAHAWHHPLPILRRTVYFGGMPVGGVMPGFGDKLSKDDIDAILAWVQSHWSDEIYGMWYQINTRAGFSFEEKKVKP